MYIPDVEILAVHIFAALWLNEMSYLQQYGNVQRSE